MNSPYNGKFYISQGYYPSRHDGLDLVGIDSKEIHATQKGTVQYAGWENPANHKQGFGLYVCIRGIDNLYYYFGHLSQLKVKTGDTVKITDVVGVEGSTGYSTGSHCHYEVRKGFYKGADVMNVCSLSGIPNKEGGTYDDGFRKTTTTTTTTTTTIPSTTATSNEEISTSTKFKVGDLVSINENAKYFDGSAIPPWVTKCNWYVASIKGVRVVLGKSEDGKYNIQSPISTVNISLANPKRDIKNTNHVKELQMTLTNKGYDCGTADGNVNDKTINAMFQALCDFYNLK